MKTSCRRLAVRSTAIVTLSLIVGCSSPDDRPDPSGFDSAEELINAVEEANVSCPDREVKESPGATSITCPSEFSVAYYTDEAFFEKKKKEFPRQGKRVLVGDQWLIVDVGDDDITVLRDQVGGEIVEPSK